MLPQAEITPSDPDTVAGFVREVEELGFDHLIAFDHVLGADSDSRPDWDGHYDHATPFLEPLTLFLRSLWTEPVVRHDGRFDRIDRAGICPLPVQRPIPVWIGCGDAPAALERVGRLADGWIPHPALGAGRRVAQAWSTVRRAAERAGRDPGALGLQGQVSVQTAAADRASGRLEKWVALGATHVALNTLEAGLRWPEHHRDLCAQVAELWRTRSVPALDGGSR